VERGEDLSQAQKICTTYFFILFCACLHMRMCVVVVVVVVF
jgi:hypothetical protein